MVHASEPRRAVRRARSFDRATPAGVCFACVMALAWVSVRPRDAGAVELTSQLSIGGGFRTNEPPPLAGLFTMALRIDVLFNRTSARQFALGPFLSLRTDNFRNFAPALGLSVLFPVSDAFPLVVSAAGLARIDEVGAAPGILQRLWFGIRSFNFHNAYSLSIGIFAETRQFFTGSSAFDFVAGLDMDLEVFALPVILAIGAARTPRGYQTH